MSLRWITRDTADAARGDPVVCVITEDGSPEPVEALQAIAQHTGERVPVLICAGPIVDAVQATAPADVVLVTAECLVTAGWLERLGAAAHRDAAVATVSAMAWAQGRSATETSALERAASLIPGRSAGIPPRLPACHGPCLYVRRSAIELVEGLSQSSSPADPEFSQRCLDAGLVHVLADDVLVGGPSPSGASPDGDGPEARSLRAARRALDGLAVVIDARALAGPRNGTRVHVLELIAALARTGRARITAIVPTELDAATRSRLRQLPVGLESPGPGDGRMSSVRGDIVHRPFQISTPADLALLSSLADRMVITHQDLISYHNPSYFRSRAFFDGYRDLTRRALGAADGVVFFSAHVRDEAVAEELVEGHRASVVALGVDHRMAGEGAPARPPGSDALDDDAEVMLCLGTDFRHKNRVFALRILEALQRRHDWSGRLVMAGPRVAVGSSLADEVRMLESDPLLAASVIDLPAVSEGEKNWLLERASLVLYPTVSEGFGLVPFESAQHGVPCLWAAGTSLSEVLGDTGAGIVAWDPEASADRALELMRDGGARAANVELIDAAAQPLRWDATAERLLDLYGSICDQPANPAGAQERNSGLMQRGVSEDAMRLVGPDGALPTDLERPLLALATHPRLGRPVLGAIKAGYRIWQRQGSGTPDRGSSPEGGNPPERGN